VPLMARALDQHARLYRGRRRAVRVRAPPDRLRLRRSADILTRLQAMDVSQILGGSARYAVKPQYLTF
jgi:hypothetical protein